MCRNNKTTFEGTTKTAENTKNMKEVKVYQDESDISSGQNWLQQTNTWDRTRHKTRGKLCGRFGRGNNSSWWWWYLSDAQRRRQTTFCPFLRQHALSGEREQTHTTVTQLPDKHSSKTNKQAPIPLHGKVHFLGRVERTWTEIPRVNLTELPSKCYKWKCLKSSTIPDNQTELTANTDIIRWNFLAQPVLSPSHKPWEQVLSRFGAPTISNSTTEISGRYNNHSGSSGISVFCSFLLQSFSRHWPLRFCRMNWTSAPNRRSTFLTHRPLSRSSQTAFCPAISAKPNNRTITLLSPVCNFLANKHARSICCWSNSTFESIFWCIYFGSTESARYSAAMLQQCFWYETTFLCHVKKKINK